MADIGSYVGKYIHLISKKQIRYGGVVHALNPDQATLELKNVRSYGSEDRPAERFVPPFPNVYPVIVFNGQDIEHLEVFDEMPDEPEPFVDPAIVSSQQPVAPPPQAAPAAPQQPIPAQQQTPAYAPSQQYQ